jgi:hypothetical protein
VKGRRRSWWPWRKPSRGQYLVVTASSGGRDVNLEGCQRSGLDADHVRKGKRRFPFLHVWTACLDWGPACTCGSRRPTHRLEVGKEADSPCAAAGGKMRRENGADGRQGGLGEDYGTKRRIEFFCASPYFFLCFRTSAGHGILDERSVDLRSW